MLSPSSGIGTLSLTTAKVIRFVRLGCTNRPFFHIVVAERWREQFEPVIEQVGSYDPLPNEHNEKLVSLNLERIRFWMGNGALVSKPVEQLLGLAGYLPIHPTSYMVAWRNRKALEAETKDQGPPRVRISFAEKVAHGLAISVSMLVIPCWVLANIKNYKAH